MQGPDLHMCSQIHVDLDLERFNIVKVLMQSALDLDLDLHVRLDLDRCRLHDLHVTGAYLLVHVYTL